MDLPYLVNFGFAAVVAGFVLVRVEASLTSLRDAVRDQTSAITGQEQRMIDATKEYTQTLSRLAASIDRSTLRRGE